MSPFTPNLSAMDLMRSGRKVPAATRRLDGRDETSIPRTFGVYICYLHELCYDEEQPKCVLDTPFPQHHRGLGVAGPLHSWYVRVGSFLYGTLHKLLREVSQNEDITVKAVLSFGDGLRHEPSCESEIRYCELSPWRPGPTSQHGISGFAPRADYQDSFAPFL
jgi:hypothetical protein